MTITEELKLSWGTQAEIATLLGVTAPIVNDVLHGKRRHFRVMDAISIALKKPKSELWPHWYEGKDIDPLAPQAGRPAPTKVRGVSID